MDCWFETHFHDRLHRGADAADLSGQAARAWSAVTTHLTPIVGSQGVDALQRRCLVLAGSQLPWLLSGSSGLQSHSDASTLAAVLAARPPAEAAAAAALLLRTLDELLTSLLGTSLTRRLLLPVHSELSGETPSQGGNP